MEDDKRHKAVEEIIGIRFKNKKLLNEALTHSSYVYEKEGCVLHNERLEFLGDVVLSLIIAEYLYFKYPTRSEGFLAKIRAMVVSRSVLAKRAKILNLGQYILLGRGEEATGGRKRESILANAFEALVGAIYLEHGLDVTSKFVLSQLKEEIRIIEHNKFLLDYKTQLQEYTQSKFKTLPVYKVVSIEGPDHDQRFTIEVSVNGKCFGVGEGKSKKDAEQRAAEAALKMLNIS